MTGPQATLRVLAHPTVVAFRQQLDALHTNGQHTPCTHPQRADWWLSDDHYTRTRAASLCAACPVLDACADAAHVLQATWGVWGARDYTPNRPHREVEDSTAHSGDRLERKEADSMSQHSTFR